MILRKPYAFLIRNFKIIHLILSGLMIYIIYRFTNILSFINEYMSSTPSVISKSVIPTLYPSSITIVFILMITFTVIIMSLMQWKKKPVTFYSALIFSVIGSAFILYYSYTIASTLEEGLVAVKTLRLVRDLVLVSTIVQFLCLIVLIIRAIGFDIKKFDFGSEILKVNETDREEFEFDVSFDTDRFKRNLRRNLRNFKYTYKENKLIINLVISLIIAGICALIYININIYNKKYNENTMVSVDGFTFGITSSSYTKYDNKNNIISSNKTYLIANLKIKSIGTNKNSIDISNFELNIDKKSYSITNKYDSRLFDLGTIYNNNEIGNEFNQYILIFEIPDDIINEKMTLIYKSNSSKNIKFKIEPKNIDKESNLKEYNLSETISFDDSLIDGTSLTINSIDIANRFRVDYNFCINNFCSNSYEYIYRSLSGNYDKTILKLDYLYNTGDKKIEGVNNIYSLINKMSTITYKVNGEYITNSASLNQLKPLNVSLNNTLFIEVDENMINAEEIIISFRLRDNIYNYRLR